MTPGGHRLLGWGKGGKSGVSCSREHMMTNAHLETVIHGGERDGSCHLLIRLESVGGGRKKRKRDGVVETWVVGKQAGGETKKMDQFC